MGKKMTRRKILAGGLKGSLVVLGSSAPLLPGGVQALWAKAAKAESLGGGTKILSMPERENLRAAADEIIPAVDNMPAPSQIGGVGYIEVVLGDEADLRQHTQAALARLERSAQSAHGKSFSHLGSAEKVALLTAFEKESAAESSQGGTFQSGERPNLFAVLRDLVYESYYTNPKVWPKIGYHFYATNEAGPAMKPFDESILANVRKMPKFYREVP